MATICPVERTHVGGKRTGPERPLTNRLALFIGLFLIAAVGVDVWLFGDEHMVFLGKKLFELIEWLAFWR